MLLEKSQVVVEVKGISKKYRIGLEEQKHETFGAQLGAWITYPIRNFRNLASLSKFRGEDETDIHWALRDINFEVSKGKVLGIIGHNGAGKSTLLKVLSRITNPTEGLVRIQGRVSSLLEVGTGFHPDLSGRDNVYMNGTILGMTKKEIDAKFQDILDFSGIGKYIDTPVKRYSSGMKVRLAFSVAAHLEPEILIIDEVLAVGDAEFQKKCLGKMEDVAGQGRTVLFVSHNMAAIKNLCQDLIVLEKGKMIYHGPVEEGINHYMKGFSKGIDGNEVPETARTFNSGEARLRRVRMGESTSAVDNETFFQDPIDIHMEIEAKKEIKDAIIDIRIGSSEGVEFGYWASKFQNNKQLNINSGNHSFDLRLQNELQPGTYYLSFGIHYGHGKTIDFVENFIRFRVFNFSKDKATSYPFSWIPGQMRIPGELKTDSLGDQLS